MEILILGGTGRARRLADVLTESGVHVTTSLAGRTQFPLAVVGETRVGGFGGSDGAVSWLREHRTDAVVDATHPYAARMSINAVTACAAVGVPLVRYEVPSWREAPEAADWTWVPDHQAAAEHAAAYATVLLSAGRQPLRHYLGLGDRRVLARMVDPPEVQVPGSWEIITRRGPFELDEERLLLAGPPPIECLVSKDSGGTRFDAKLVAAAELGAQVVMVERPSLPDPDAIFTEVDDVVAWVHSLPAG